MPCICPDLHNRSKCQVTVAGRKEAEGITSAAGGRRLLLQGARQSSEELEPVSVRKSIISRGGRAAGTPAMHAPKFATGDTSVNR